VSTEHIQSSSTGFNITTDRYSGPLDLLIELIEKRKFLVNDISIASVADDYMQYVTQFEKSPLHDMAEFIVLASTLLLLKSKSLLPVLQLTDAEEESIDTLEIRLKHYQIYRNASKILIDTFGKKRQYERRFVPHTKPLFVTDPYTTTTALHRALVDVIAHLPKKIEKPKVRVKTVVSLETMMLRLKERIEKQFTCTFSEFTGSNAERVTIVVGFLAILEMIKQGSITVTQSEKFHDIAIERDAYTPPRYE
jgi:segregation and condensation protein A